MAIAILTSRALERLAAGATLNYAGSELFEVLGVVQSHDVRAIYCKGDQGNEPLVGIAVADPKSIIPDALRGNREAAYGRILSFVQRARSFPVVLPRGWRQYKSDNLLAFFALPEALGGTDRWIAEVNIDGRGDVMLWKLTDSEDQQLLRDYRPDHPLARGAREFWEAGRTQGLSALTGQPASTLGVDVTLDVAPQVQSVARSRTFSQWRTELTKSQLDFVEAPTDRSIRLRGPAGSGKTLSMCLKAVREVSNARAEGRVLRVLFVTHSWSLAGEVDEILASLSEYGQLDEITVLPLVSVAQELLPSGMTPTDLTLVGDDSLTGKMTQLSQIEEVIEEFQTGDWVTFRNTCSDDLRARLDSSAPDVMRGLAWDCLIEFGCVLGADGIFPGLNAEKRYLKVPRAPWMMRLEGAGDKRALYALYTKYYESLQERRLLTSDQLLNDFLNYLEGFTWNHRRKLEGYDLIFVDEFHLFNTLERHTLRYLGREVTTYPRLFMAMDPRQSPWEVFFAGSDAQGTTGAVASEDELEQVETVDIPTVHRSSPQILDLIKHIHLEYANLNLDEDWGYSISAVESLATPGPKPALFVRDTLAEEEVAIYKAVVDLYPQAHAGAQLALAIIDEDSYRRYGQLIQNIGASGKYKVISITSRDDVGALQYHNRGIVVGPAEYLAGLQFDTVLIAGLPEIAVSAPNQGVRRRGALSLLYLAASRASREVRFFANEDFGGVPEVLARAGQEGVLGIFKGDAIAADSRKVQRAN
jgi:hypothetical protein